MKTIQFLSVSIALAVIAGGCKGEPGPVGPVSLARESNVAYNDLDDPADSLVVSFEGTRIRITNTSGGSRIAANKLIVFHADWNIHAWTSGDSAKSVDVTTMDWNGYIEEHIRIKLHCRGSDEYMVMGSYWVNPLRRNLFALQAPGYDLTKGSFRPGNSWRSALLNNIFPISLRDCEAPFLSIVDAPQRFFTRAPGSEYDPSAPVDFERNTGGTWKIEGGTIALNDVDFFIAPRLSITYHPVVSDSSQIERETLWLQTIVDDRQGFVDHIDRALPVDMVFTGGGVNSIPRWDAFEVGTAVHVPVDTVKCNDGLFKAYWKLARSEMDRPRIEPGGGAVNIRVAVLRDQLRETYCDQFNGGVGSLGRPTSAFVYRTDPLYRGSFYESETLIHELGHNLGLGHTPTFHNPDIYSPARDYPLPSGLIDKDGYLVRGIVKQEIHVWNAESTYDFMSYGSPSWVSNYNWNKMLDHVSNNAPSVAARAVAGGDQIWICNGQH